MEQRVTGRREWLDAVEIGSADASEIEEVLDVLARGMNDNPLTVATFGTDPEQRRQRFRRFVGTAAKALGWGPNMLVTRDADGTIAGACNAMPPGECLSSPSRQPQILPSLPSNGPHVAERAMCWLEVWSRRDPKERHWHLGPLAGGAHRRGGGVGSLLMQVFSARMDAAGEEAYLETDKSENVRFYERFGFELISEEEVLGATNYFMLRRSEGRHG